MDMAIKERKVIDIESPSCWGEFNLPYCTIRVSPPLFAIVQTQTLGSLDYSQYY